MNLHTIHVLNDRLQAAIQAEDLIRIQTAYLDILVEATVLGREEERKKQRDECKTALCDRGTTPDAGHVPGLDHLHGLVRDQDGSSEQP